MPDVFQPFLDLLTNPPGNLIYHLVVAFSLVAALPVSLYLGKSDQPVLSRRLLIGFLPLVVIRLALFVVGGLAWQGLIAEQALLPALERSAGLVSLIILLWLWGFPQPQRRADFAALLFSFFGLFFGMFLCLWWLNQAGTASFNGSLIDQTATITAVVVALLAITLLILKRPDGWSAGLLFFLVIAAGYLLHWLFPSPEQDASGVIRLAEIIAYPLLILIPLRSPLAVTAELPAARAESATPPERLTPLEMQLIQTCLSLPLDMQRGQLSNALSALFARALRADLCCLVSPPDETWQIILHGGYDLIREVNLEGGVLDGRQMPTLAANLRHAKPMRMKADAPTPDLSYLASCLGLKESGDLLMGVILAEDQSPLFGVILLSPYSRHAWSGEEQIELVNLSRMVGKLLRQLQPQIQATLELAETRQALAETQAQVDALQAQLSALQEKEVQESEVEQPSTIPATLPGLTANDSASLEGELRLALEEIARLRGELEETQQQLRRAQIEGSSGETVNLLANLGTELRQPLASIVGYTDFLLGESVGILGTLQRKFLERIRLATQRMMAILNDYTPATDLQGSQIQLNVEAVSLKTVIENALSEVRELQDSRHVELQLDLPAELSPASGDPGALEQILVKLLQNALKVSPKGGTVHISAREERENTAQGYLLLQIQDSGGGIAPEHLPDLFARERRIEIPGVAENGAALYIVKTLVEALNGRIWVDSRPGEGTTFSILLSTASPNGKELAEESEL
ncbi:MAG: Phosphate regulon sensor protein PhoR (SphS) [Anaerolineae bacterium]|nr:MAG: Phosphate regulon sensor protein PhoR (SphS) [Anaerolineae bacterium]